MLHNMNRVVGSAGVQETYFLLHALTVLKEFIRSFGNALYFFEFVQVKSIDVWKK